MDHPLHADHLSDYPEENDVISVNASTCIRPNVKSQAKAERLAGNAFNLGYKFLQECHGADWIMLCNVRPNNTEIVLDPRREFKLHF